MRVLFLLLMVCFATSAFAKERIYFIAHAGAGDPFWNVTYNGVQQASRDHKVDVVFMAPETPNDIARQVELFEAAIAAKPDGIALSVPSDLSFSRGLKKAAKSNIPVVIVNTQPSPAAKAQNPHLSFIGMDDLTAGMRVAERALASGKLSKRVLIANHQPGHLGLEQRLKGLQTVFASKNIAVDKLDISDDAANVTNAIQSYLNKKRDATGVFCLGPTCVHSIGRYFQRQGRPIFLASFDLSPFTVQLIKEGIVAFTIDQQPYKQGYLGVDQLVRLIRDRRPPQSIETASSFIVKENANEVFELVKKGIR